MSVSLSPIGGAGWQFFDNNGNPLTGGKLYTYEAGTTTPKATYTTDAGNVAHSNPIILDSAGRVPSGGEIWLTDGVAYKFVLKTSTEVLLGTWDNVSMTGTIGADTVTYTPAGVSAVTTTVQTKLREIVSIKDFGAVGDGVADDTTALQNALANVGADGWLLFPPGTYSITSSNTFYLLEAGCLCFEAGAVLAPTQGSDFILDAQIQAGDYQIFEVGKQVPACRAVTSGNTLVSFWPLFTSNDIGKPVCLRYGGTQYGVDGLYTVGGRYPFNTTVTGYSDARQISLASPPISEISPGYVIDAGYAYVNTGLIIIGNGTVEFTQKVTALNVKWFGATGSASGNDTTALQSAFYAYSRRYNGGGIRIPRGTYVQYGNLSLDVGNTTITGEGAASLLFRANNIPLEAMNSVTCVWRGRYGGGGPTGTEASQKPLFNFVPKWQGDWSSMSNITFRDMMINGNSSNQPTLTPGSGIDAWDAGISALYTQHLTADNVSFVNHLRWGIALSTLSHHGKVVNCFADSCAEGAYYAETSTDIIFSNNSSYNSPAAGWNMGAITFLNITRGVAANNTLNGGNNGIYVRNFSYQIQVTGNSIQDMVENGVWTMDETLGSARGKVVSITGNTIRGGKKGIKQSWLYDTSISGNSITGCSEHGIYVQQSVRCNISGNTLDDNTLRDILIDAGTQYINAIYNLGDVELTGTSTAYCTFNISQGFIYTDSTTVTPGYISIIYANSYGDGNGRSQFREGGITIPTGWDKYPLSVGNAYVLWVDGSGRLRIKTGFPTSDTDGVVVGTQT